MTEAEAQRTGLPRRLAIPGTLLISALGIVGDVRRCVTMDLKEPGHCLALASRPVGDHGFDAALALHRQVAALIREGHVYAAHDISDGGVAVALAEMCIAAGFGFTMDDVSRSLPRLDLFEPIATSYLLEMKESRAKEAGLTVLGHVEQQGRFRVGRDGRWIIDQPVSALSHAWRGGFDHTEGT
jgi:phosphoribosylformylglycinamidine synthase